LDTTPVSGSRYFRLRTFANTQLAPNATSMIPPTPTMHTARKAKTSFAGTSKINTVDHSSSAVASTAKTEVLYLRQRR
ncbi:hypothetical protein, partial [Litorivivens sp.]|uniref:hypothetical protein n=1 Tax=Litorivivens sp. TaxID=2020868 RepID=UPI003568BF60